MQQRFPVTHRSSFQTTPERLWAALTEPALVQQYFYGTQLHTDWIPGHSIRFTGSWEGKEYEDKGTVLDYVPLQHVRYSYLSSWSGMPDAPENYLEISYRLQPLAPDAVELVITQTNYDAERAAHSEQS